MADKGPFLTSCIIFYLSIGAAIFQLLEEPNWKTAKAKYILQKENILKKYVCLTKEDLDGILETVSEAAGQGVAITGDNHLNLWDWGNSVIFAATIVTTIGYGNVAPKTKAGRVFCILYGLCGIPLCLVWISELGTFFGDRAKRLSQVLIRKGVSVEGWSYLEGIYFSFITLTTVGFGDYVAGVNPNIDYPRLYRVFAELWIYMGLAWLSLFFSWNVHMVVEAHKVLKKRRQKHRHPSHEEPQSEEDKHNPVVKPSVVDIFNFMSDKEEDYSTVIKGIGNNTKGQPADNINRSKSCSDILTLDHSPRHRRLVSISEVFMNTKADVGKDYQERYSLIQINKEDPERAESTQNPKNKASHASNSEIVDSISTVPTKIKFATEEQTTQKPDGGGTRFKISKVNEVALNENENG
ncbi:potassium channel subfamily K member 5-like isoform X2 [Echeneis naucrates]|uniref:potassium channel subfamily K member 5-like isoform X2 n=1 Tax=Echeneis naucrates TaxID=173247 RepID=UPI0011138E4A|nr:potassium channel subfamily K member 5-like isoform X2 [Echeneis naucrates]